MRFGLSEKHAVLLLALIATALGGTSLAYNVLDDQRLALVGVLVTFVLLVQFASFLADVERRVAPGGDAGARSRRSRCTGAGSSRSSSTSWLITGAFAAAYAIRFGWPGTDQPAPHRRR